LYQLGSQFTDESLEAMKQELNPDSVKDVTVGGLAAIDGQVQGERNRFVTHIITKKGRLSLFTAEPTAENKLLTEKILSTFVFTE
jgi:predicted Zn-dependent protease